MINYLIETLTSIEANNPYCGIIVMGDLNRLNTSHINRQFKLKQLVKFSTRGRRTLDVILTNLSQFYDQPEKLPPFGLSDHFTIKVLPMIRPKRSDNIKILRTRDTSESNKMALGRVLSGIDWSCLHNLRTCDDKFSFFNDVLLVTMDIIMPIKEKRICTSDAPWMTEKLKSNIRKRQKSLKKGNQDAFKYYRNQVNRERKRCRQVYYRNKVENLKHTKPNDWWSAVKKICGMSPLYKPELRLNLQIEMFDNMNGHEIANTINKMFLEPLKDFQPLNSINFTITHENIHTPYNSLHVSEEDVYEVLKSTNPFKAFGSDNIPAWIYKQFAEILSLPVSIILNSSYEEQKLPSVWKTSNVVPIPKTTPVETVNKHLRPIALTPIISKVAEEFVIKEHLKPAILEVLDPDQFGVIPGSSTCHALIKLIHKWSESTDGNGSTIRVVLLDYQKAFDFIDHSILVSKLKLLRIPIPTLNWIINFLTNRKQRVKLASDCLSEWGNVSAGVPQGTKLGPWLFVLMINDLRPDGVDQAKFVDDLTISETVLKSGVSIIQNSVNSIKEWSDNNSFRLHDGKCKELRIDFKQNRSIFSPISTNDKQIEVVNEVKLLGMTLRSDLRWNSHVHNIISKCSKRLYLLIQLKRANIAKKISYNSTGHALDRYWNTRP